MSVAALVSGEAAAGPSAEQTSAPSTAARDQPTVEALRATIQRHIAVLGDGQGPPRARACKTNSEGVCLYREKKKKAITTAPPGGGETSENSQRAPSPDERELIAAYEAYLAHPDAADAGDRDAARYHLARLLAETGEPEAAIAHLLVLTEAAASPELAAWAGALLLDELVIRWTQAADLEANVEGARRLSEQLARLQSLPLWRHEAARPLRELAPRLDAGIRWREGFGHLERGRNARDFDERSAAFLACADAFLALHADYGADHDKADTLLWNAARCYEAASRPLAAAQSERLLDLYPDSEHAQETTHYLASVSLSLALYGRAAEWYERFAARFARDSRAPRALATAIELRAALGPKEALQADLEAYESLYRRKDPKRAAEISWSGYALLTTDDRSRRAYAERYLKIYGRRGGRGRELIAQVAVADTIWSATCPLRQTDAGLCVAVADGKEVSLRFTDSPVVGRHQLHTRKLRRRRSADAQASLAGFRRALIILEHTRIDIPPDDTRQLRDLAYASARAWLALADALFETLLDGSNPALASGRPPKTPDPRTHPWRSQSRPIRGHEAASIADDARLSVLAGVRGPLAEVVDQLERAYASLEERHVGTPSAAIASARRGQLAEWLMDHVLIGETSPSRPCESTGHRSRRCTTTKERYDALRSATRDAYARCVAQMPYGAVADETAELCLRELAVLDPTNPAHLPELFGTSGPYDAEEPAALADRAGVITDYETVRSAAEPAAAATDAE